MKKTIQRRLAALPPKVAQPLTHLVKTGQMQEKDIRTVLDAGDLTGNHHTLVGFAAGAMGMKAQGVPIADTVSMAKKQGVRIRLDWTPRRWREEHDRMAKVVTLRQFSEKNVDYDVDSYTKLLPDFPGYIIRNSRRLATVGWYQRHCVASYHNRVVRGQCVFVCVFVNHTRWTVEILKTEDPFNPLQICQIRTTDNRLPDPATEQQIYDYLGINGCDREPNDYLRRRQEAYKLRQVTAVNLTRVHQTLAEAGVECVYMNYDPDPVPLGGLPEIVFAPDSLENIHGLPVQLYSPSDNRDENGQLIIELRPDTLGNCLSQLQQSLLAERRDNVYRWRAPAARAHYQLKLDVAERVVKITKTSSNGLTLRSQIKTSTTRVDIEECPDIDGMLQPV